MKYRKEIDGLRALAILPVLFFHAGLPFLSGGYLGVDIFFVISGFLITSIIHYEINNNKFSILTFYERRLRRILPALATVLLFTSIAIAFFESSPKALHDYGDSLVSAILMFSNIYFFLTSSYFGPASELSPLLHTWSLAVEEQFYVLFPILAIFCKRLNTKSYIALLILISLISIGIAEWGWRNSAHGNFYLLPSRAWELLAGSLAAIYINSNKVHNTSKEMQSFLSLFGLLCITFSFFLFNKYTPHPSILTFLPILGTFLIIVFSSQHNFTGKILSSRLLVHIGLISYSLYLWHYPIFVMVKLEAAPEHQFAIKLLLLPLIYLFSITTYKFIETPFRNKQLISSRNIFKYSFVSIISIFFLGILYINNTIIQRVIHPQETKRFDMLLTAHNAHEKQVMFDDKQCKFWSPSIEEKFENRFIECSKKHKKAIFVLGGSHGMDLYNAIALNSTNNFVVSVSRGYCRAHEFIGKSKAPHKCQYEDFKAFAKKHQEKIALVIYTQTPDQLFTKPMPIASPDDLPLKNFDQVASYLNDIKTTYRLNVMMIGMLPPMDISPIHLNYKEDINTQLANNISKNTIQLTKLVDQLFIEKLNIYDIPYITKFDGFKLNFPDDFIQNEQITYSDNRHLSYEGEKVFGARLVKYLGL